VNASTVEKEKLNKSCRTNRHKRLNFVSTFLHPRRWVHIKHCQEISPPPDISQHFHDRQRFCHPDWGAISD
jgi:hypothetical protein